jgi:3-phosphoglycerate kinase
MLQTVSDLNDLDYYGKKVLTRVDFNVTLNNDVIGEDYRIRMTLPTIEYLTKRGAKVILMSHLGRPKSSTTANSPFTDPKFSLAPVAKRLSEILLVNKVTFATDCIGHIAQKKIYDMNMGDVLLLENLRFHREEEQNNSEFCKQLASLADIYVNDAFSSSHRKHASTYGTPKLFDTRVGGLTLKKEVEYLSMIRDNPTKPFTLVVGGVKIKDKIGALESLLPRADSVLVGGVTAYTFLKANGTRIGNSQVDDEHLNWVTKALSNYGNKIILPTDHIVSRAQDSSSVSLVKGDIPDGMIGFDIGIETSQQYSNQIAAKSSGTIFWNGPMGLFEIKHFANGTDDIAKTMALAYWRGSKTLIGGGDTLEAMKRAGVSEREVSHVSTGGGATLRFLAGDEMPGIDILQE